MIAAAAPIPQGYMLQKFTIAGLAMAALARPGIAMAGCDSSVETGTISAIARAVEDGFVSMEASAVRGAGNRMAEALPCVAAPLTPDLSARVHRSMGLAAVVNADLDAAARSFWSARRADPDLQMSDSLAPAGTPVRNLFERPAPYVEDTELERPNRGSLLLDGTSSLQRPGGRPVIVQHLSGSGRLLGTWWVDAGAPMPALPWDDPRRGARLGLRAGGVGLALVGAGLLVGAGSAATQHGDPKRVDELDAERLEGLRDRSRALSVAGGAAMVLGGASVGLSYSGGFR